MARYTAKIYNPLTTRSLPQISRSIAQSSLGRTVQPDNIASIATFLASDDSYWLTGEQLLATGGIR